MPSNLSHPELEPLLLPGDNVTFPRASFKHSLQATKKQDKEPDNIPSSCRHRIEESTG